MAIALSVTTEVTDQTRKLEMVQRFIVLMNEGGVIPKAMLQAFACLEHELISKGSANFEALWTSWTPLPSPHCTYLLALLFPEIILVWLLEPPPQLTDQLITNDEWHQRDRKILIAASGGCKKRLQFGKKYRAIFQKRKYKIIETNFSLSWNDYVKEVKSYIKSSSLSSSSSSSKPYFLL
jgi:hypothetical protein